MEIPDQDVGLNTDGSLNPEQEQEQQDDSEPDTQPKSNQEIPEPRKGPPSQVFIESRILQLHNRRLILLEQQHFIKREEDNMGGTTEEMNSEDSGEPCELEAIEKELEELLVKKEELDKQGKSSKLSDGQQDVCPTFCKTETPCGGIYLLPPPQLTEEDIALDWREKNRTAAEEPKGTTVSADSLGQMPALTQCPSCQEVVFTETCRKRGEATWILCYMCIILGCAAGCCLIPFFLDRLKNVQHRCPRCQALIHTYRPF
ncbi:uncharacterized protein LOC127372957 [Dicentrarchus labrax]|uniref:uncharacterized protein LOC127372957 n=1 Tax=Dicentrarchus labrax TaxID=13489 RepID=UPI0021F64F65|nr:uncharacterized protein LOC127372957 [Dicentrarchus labrax]